MLRSIDATAGAVSSASSTGSVARLNRSSSPPIWSVKRSRTFRVLPTSSATGV